MCHHPPWCASASWQTVTQSPSSAAGIPWLIEKFKQYVVLRDRLFSDTSVLRNKLQDAIPGGFGVHWWGRWGRWGGGGGVSRRAGARE